MSRNTDSLFTHFFVYRTTPPPQPCCMSTPTPLPQKRERIFVAWRNRRHAQVMRTEEQAKADSNTAEKKEEKKKKNEECPARPESAQTQSSLKSYTSTRTAQNASGEPSPSSSSSSLSFCSRSTQGAHCQFRAQYLCLYETDQQKKKKEEDKEGSLPCACSSTQKREGDGEDDQGGVSPVSPTYSPVSPPTDADLRFRDEMEKANECNNSAKNNSADNIQVVKGCLCHRMDGRCGRNLSADHCVCCRLRCCSSHFDEQRQMCGDCIHLPVRQMETERLWDELP